MISIHARNALSYVVFRYQRSGHSTYVSRTNAEELLAAQLIKPSEYDPACFIPTSLALVMVNPDNQGPW